MSKWSDANFANSNGIMAMNSPTKWDGGWAMAPWLCTAIALAVLFHLRCPLPHDPFEAKGEKGW